MPARAARTQVAANRRRRVPWAGQSVATPGVTMAIDDHDAPLRELAQKPQARADAAEERRQMQVLVRRVQVAVGQRETHHDRRDPQPPLEQVHDRNRAANLQKGRRPPEPGAIRRDRGAHSPAVARGRDRRRAEPRPYRDLDRRRSDTGDEPPAQPIDLRGILIRGKTEIEHCRGARRHDRFGASPLMATPNRRDRQGRTDGRPLVGGVPRFAPTPRRACLGDRCRGPMVRRQPSRGARGPEGRRTRS